MSDDRNAANADAAHAPSLHDAEANRQMGAGKTPQAESPHNEAGRESQAAGDRPPNVGDAHAPTSADDVVEGADKTLYDRLADKDVTPSGEQGSRPV